MKHGDPRPDIVGPDAGPEAPFPLKLEGEVVKGFGRGSKELGIPTANIPISGLSIADHTDLASGIYFGFVRLLPVPPSAGPSDTDTDTDADADADTDGANNNNNSSSAYPMPSRSLTFPSAGVYPMCMSIGWNPYYKNSVRSVEVHVMHRFASNFYGANMRLLILGYVRDELDYVSKEALVDDILTDIRVTSSSLDRAAWRTLAEDSWLRGDMQEGTVKGEAEARSAEEESKRGVS